MSCFVDLPQALLDQLSAMPEEAPADFTCAICRKLASNSYHWSPRDYERPPICRSCENVSGYDWTGRPRLRTIPKGGSPRDRRQAMRIGALADAIAHEANRQIWSAQHGRP